VSVIVYSTPTCAFCHMSKQYLRANKIDFVDKDITVDAKAYQEVVQKMNGNYHGVPVIDIDNTIILGFDRPRIDIALKEKGLL